MFTRANMFQRIQTTTDLLEVIQGDAELQQRITSIGFDQARLDEGRTLRDKAIQEMVSVQEQRGENLKTREEVVNLGRDVRSAYMLAVRLAREALRHQPEVQLKLDLIGAREPQKKPERWIGQARTFYMNVTGDIQTALTPFGLTPSRIANDRAALQLYARSLSLTGEHHAELGTARNRRRAAFGALDSWLRNLEIILRHVTKGDPILRQKLGLVTQRPQRTAPVDTATPANPVEPETKGKVSENEHEAAQETTDRPHRTNALQEVPGNESEQKRQREMHVTAKAGQPARKPDDPEQRDDRNNNRQRLGPVSLKSGRHRRTKKRQMHRPRPGHGYRRKKRSDTLVLRPLT